ncbi:tethering factor for nuclear proteasome STS1 [Scheffersomyces amazonensis]|uniref:tethering factor for nuclear proteasome STS1 n=1 Tax=Scheffersomyces amazonensis TaxID=1078765 RepID=UPI00315CF504
MISTGFHWGSSSLPVTEDHKHKSGNEDNSNPIITSTSALNSIHNTAGTVSASSKTIPRSLPPMNDKKRKFDDKAPSPIPSTTSSRKYHELPTNRNKKSKTPRILGQVLPVPRLIEVLDHKSLQSLLQNLVDLHPEISNTINNLSPKPSVKDSMELLQVKFNDIINHLPYKCDEESDYSYLRIKPLLNEFLNCLSDFILNFLPPIEHNIINSLNFLHFITNLIHNLPNFTSNEFQYTKMMAYEQIANTWFIVLTQNIQGIEIDDYMLPPVSNIPSTESNQFETSNESIENSIKLVKIIEELDLLQKLSKHNELALDKFKNIIEFLKFEINQVETFNHIYQQTADSSASSSTNGVFGDLITVDYSNFSISARTSH